ncbi:hypothetical protein L207DRAFT_493251 [Hyaloscypha variabilis F]|uniref:Heterokaryon incompatibility domain-containing protein n=1 Tax=Hyaloscypha variabilis (strain UAMH 11265 / GT02V1 / F) TaxID=1149755 RepID=A0A2J6RGS8_HYAVF|nr:hypothetical protein L207DRAFT_493251 [Hyaloscypha variabilis F]
MDHFLLPKEPSSPVIRVSHLGRQRYDGGPFLAYGRRSGLIKEPSTSDEHVSFEWLLRARNDRMPKDEFQGFLQTWLIFGMLVEFAVHSQFRNSLLPVDGLDPESDDDIRRLLVQTFYNIWLVKDEEGQEYINSSQLVSILQAFGEWPGTDETRRGICSHLGHCLQLSNVIITTVRQELDHDIADSIVAVHESLAGTVEKSSWTYFGSLITSLHLGWGHLGFFNEEIVESMISNGWCKSDIARIVDRYSSLQLYHFMSKLAKPNTRRSHINCSETRCVAHQIVPTEYNPSHWPAECQCESIVIENSATVPILMEEGRIPLLRIGVGDSVDDTVVEVIGSTIETQYIAISHVWSDGMGNPHMTALPKCQLVRLKEYAQKLKDSCDKLFTTHETEVLIWLDTLCCPVEPLEAKKLALRKMRKTYRESTLVPVVDNSLTCCEVDDWFEAASRILTSPHTRRLWTLQEIALPQVLFWQFSNQTIGVAILYQNISTLMQDPRLRGFGHDLVIDIGRHAVFFHSLQAKRDGFQTLSDLESALAFRGVSYPADEALCLGTLLSLPEKEILDVEEDQRMQKVWELFAKKYKSFPADAIFSRRPERRGKSWRWAPSTMLGTPQRARPGVAGYGRRISMWQGPGTGTPTEWGLQVRFPGWRLFRSDAVPDPPPSWWSSIYSSFYPPPKPPEPAVPKPHGHNWWDKFTSLAEVSIQFRDPRSGKWCQLSSLDLDSARQTWTQEQWDTWIAEGKKPLCEFIESGKCAVVYQPRDTNRKMADDLDEYQRQHVWRGVMVYIDDEHIVARGNGMRVYAYCYALVQQLPAEKQNLFDQVEQWAHEIDQSELVKRLENCELDSEEYKTVRKELVEHMKNMVKEHLEKNPQFEEAVQFMFGDVGPEMLWGFVGDWKRQDIVARRLRDDQIWYFDG